MRLLYITNARLPSQRANSIQVAKTCDALSKSCNLTLILPAKGTNKEHSIEEIWEYYNLKNKFTVKKVSVLDVGFLKLIKPPIAWYAISTGTFALSAVNFVRKNKGFDAVYTRHAPTAILYNKLKKIWNLPPFYFEAHKFGPMNEKAVCGADGLITTTTAAQRRFKKNYSGKSVVIPNGIDLNEFKTNPTSKQVRKKLGLPEEKKIAVYIGQTYSWKGTDILEHAAELLPENYLVVFVGASSEDTEKKKYMGYVERRKAIQYLQAADVFVLPNVPKGESIEFTSPLKMFEYMASKKPIVASDLASLREMLTNGKNAILVKAADPDALASGIKKAATDSKLARKITQQAYLDVSKFTWDKRAKKILAFIK